MDRPKNRSYIPGKSKEGFVVTFNHEKELREQQQNQIPPSDMNQPKRPKKEITGWTYAFFLGTVLALLGHAGTSYDHQRGMYAFFAILGAASTVLTVHVNDL